MSLFLGRPFCTASRAAAISFLPLASLSILSLPLRRMRERRGKQHRNCHPQVISFFSSSRSLPLSFSLPSRTLSMCSLYRPLRVSSNCVCRSSDSCRREKERRNLYPLPSFVLLPVRSSSSLPSLSAIARRLGVSYVLLQSALFIKRILSLRLPFSLSHVLYLVCIPSKHNAHTCVSLSFSRSLSLSLFLFLYLRLCRSLSLNLL